MNCEKASILSQKAEDKPLSFIDRFKLKLHLFLCGPCKWFGSQNSLLSKAVSKMYGEQHQEKKLSDIQKRAIIEQALEN